MPSPRSANRLTCPPPLLLLVFSIIERYMVGDTTATSAMLHIGKYVRDKIPLSPFPYATNGAQLLHVLRASNDEQQSESMGIKYGAY